MATNETEPHRTQLEVSQPLEDAILMSSHMVKSGEPVDVPQILLAILQQESLAKRSFEVVSRGHFPMAQLTASLSHYQINDKESAGMITVNGQQIPITEGVESLLTEAQNQARGALSMDTGHVIQAELERLDSVLGTSLISINYSGTPLATVVSNYINGARSERIYPPEIQAQRSIEMNVRIGNSHIVDLLAQAKAGSFSGTFVNPEWTLSLVQSLSSHSVTMLMTEYEAEVTLAMQGLAEELSGHDASYVNIPRVVAPSATYLIEHPDEAITEAVRQAEGGVLILPEDPRYLMHKAVRVALEQQKIRLVSFAAEQSWEKAKSTMEQLGAYELYLSPPTQDMLLNMLTAQKSTLEGLYNQHNGTDMSFQLTISDEALREAVKLGYRYASVMGMPSILAAQQLLEAAATNLKLAHSGMHSLLPASLQADNSIDLPDVYLALKTITGIETQPEDPARYLDMERELGKEIVGQDEAIAIISDTVRRSETVLRDPKRPRGVFMFLGPSGVGKTELAKDLNDFLFHDDRSFIQLNMSEYQEQHAVAKLIGAPPGYVGYEEGGQLTERVRKQPYSIVVIDEIDKAHPKVFDVFLQVFEEGQLTDGKGRSVDFSNTIIILTGNIGSEYFSNVDSRGFAAVKQDVLREVQEFYRPEFLNRIDNIIVFKPLSPEAIKAIVDIQVHKLNQRLADMAITLELTPAMHEYLEKVGYDPKYGARPLRRAVELYIGNKLTPKLLSHAYVRGDTVMVDYQSGQVILSR